MDYLLEDGFVGRASRRHARNACIREDDVKFAKVFGELSEKPLAILRNRNVSAIAVRFRSQLGHRFIQCLLIATRNCDFRAFRDEKAGRGQADAAVASGDESLFACELHHFLLADRLIAILGPGIGKIQATARGQRTTAFGAYCRKHPLQADDSDIKS